MTNPPKVIYDGCPPLINVDTGEMIWSCPPDQIAAHQAAHRESLRAFIEVEDAAWDSDNVVFFGDSQLQYIRQCQDRAHQQAAQLAGEATAAGKNPEQVRLLINSVINRYAAMVRTLAD